MYRRDPCRRQTRREPPPPQLAENQCIQDAEHLYTTGPFPNSFLRSGLYTLHHGPHLKVFWTCFIEVRCLKDMSDAIALSVNPPPSLLNNTSMLLPGQRW